MKRLIVVLAVTLLSTQAYARDYFQEEKYSNSRPRGSDSVYDLPTPSRSYDYKPQVESYSPPAVRTYDNTGTSQEGSSRYNYGDLLRADR
jgi:hypothetical protein